MYAFVFSENNGYYNLISIIYFTNNNTGERFGGTYDIVREKTSQIRSFQVFLNCYSLRDCSDSI